MPSTRTALISALLTASALAKTIDVNVGKNDENVYEPDSVTASKGDTINFHFYPGDHNVAQSSFSKPCVPSGDDAVYSGFFNPENGVASTMWSMMVNSTDTMWIYCGKADHCEEGMAMVINPSKSGSDTLDAYKKAASSAESKNPSMVQGGVIKANSMGSSSGSSSSTSGQMGMFPTMLSGTMTASEGSAMTMKSNAMGSATSSGMTMASATSTASGTMGQMPGMAASSSGSAAAASATGAAAGLQVQGPAVGLLAGLVAWVL